ncbi:MAG: hypothetical protein EA345_10115 [Halomonas sp.]|nr:MAG: hypothetical protein EA345_10115 [Halomonas sp.]
MGISVFELAVLTLVVLNMLIPNKGKRFKIPLTFESKTIPDATPACMVNKNEAGAQTGCG